MSKYKFIAPGGLFGKYNPPPYREMALRRLEELEENMRDMNFQLEHPRPNYQRNPLDCEEWRKKVMRALFRYKSETEYLKNWPRNEHR